MTFGRVLAAALVAALVACAAVGGVLAYYAASASRASDVATTAAVRAAFTQAAGRWRSQIDLPVHRLALRSVEEYASGKYLFVFEVYGWFGIGSGYATHGDGGGGGLLRDGGFAGLGERGSDSGLEETRAAWTRTYGPGRIVAPPP